MLCLQAFIAADILAYADLRVNIKCQSRDFLTDLCCNTIITLVSVVFIAWIPTLILKIDNILVCLAL